MSSFVMSVFLIVVGACFQSLTNAFSECNTPKTKAPEEHVLTLNGIMYTSTYCFVIA